MNNLPPQSIELEETVLGALMLEGESILQVPFLKPESFYKDANQRIFKAIHDLTVKNIPVDLFTVQDELTRQNQLEAAGGIIYITTLTSKVVSAANVEYHARIVHQKYIQRELIRIGAEIQQKAQDSSNDVSDLFEYAENELLKITGQVQTKEPSKLGKLIDTVLDKIQKIINHEIKLVGCPSGFTGMDRKTGGFKNGELIIIAGRPSMGKSALALQIALNSASLNVPVAFFSVEMSDESLAQRTISGASGKTNVQLLEGFCNMDELVQKTENLINLPVFIDDTGAISVMQLRSKIRRLILREGIKLVIVDYLQLMSGEGQSREQEVSKISRGLKGIAKEFNLPVIALSQLSRKPEERSDKKPMLSDLRESGAIEQDADMVCFVYRPAYYGVRSAEVEGASVSTDGLMELMIAKNRNGAIGSYFLKHNIALTEITEYETVSF